jgi:hypothetical protein
MRKLFPLFSYVVVLCMLLNACAAAQPGVMPLGAGETLAGLRSAMAGQPGTFIMQRGDLILLAWPNWSSYSFAIMDISGRANDLAGLSLNTFSFSEMIKSLEGGGWKYISPGAVPAALAQALGAYTIELVMAGVQSLPTVMLVPVTVLTPKFRSVEVQQ